MIIGRVNAVSGDTAYKGIRAGVVGRLSSRGVGRVERSGGVGSGGVGQPATRIPPATIHFAEGILRRAGMIIGRINAGSGDPAYKGNRAGAVGRVSSRGVGRLSAVEELEKVVSANLQHASHLLQAILQKAFTGELV